MPWTTKNLYNAFRNSTIFCSIFVKYPRKYCMFVTAFGIYASINLLTFLFLCFPSSKHFEDIVVFKFDTTCHEDIFNSMLFKIGSEFSAQQKFKKKNTQLIIENVLPNIETCSGIPNNVFVVYYSYVFLTFSDIPTAISGIPFIVVSENSVLYNMCARNRANLCPSNEIFRHTYVPMYTINYNQYLQPLRLPLIQLGGSKNENLTVM